MLLSATTSKLQVVLAGAKATVDADVVTTYRDITYFNIDATQVNPGTTVTNTNGTTAVDIVAAPKDGDERQVTSLFLYNADSAAITATIRYNANATNYVLKKVTLAVGDSLNYTDSGSWFVTDNSGNVKSTGSSGTGRLLRTPQALTSGTSYTTPTNCTGILVEALGGGGGGGGGDSSASNCAVGGGGAAGAYARKFYTVTAATAYTYAIGAAGAAGAATSAATGGTGGDTTFTDGVTLATAKGGLGGVGQAVGTTAAIVLGGLGVISTNGDTNTPGAPGLPGHRVSGTVGVSGNGGSGRFGSGGIGRITDGAGAAGLGRGSGGAGTCNLSAANAGGAGTAGLLLITEYA